MKSEEAFDRQIEGHRTVYVTSAYEVQIGDSEIFADASDIEGVLVIALPSASTVKGMSFSVFAVSLGVNSSCVACTVSSPDTIMGKPYYFIESEGDSVVLTSNGSEYWIK